MNRKEVLEMLSRYFILLIITFLSVNNRFLYEIFSPLTIVPVHEILQQIYPSIQYIPFYSCPGQIAPALVLKGYYACIIDACVAGAAYLFLILLNLSTPMHLIKRIKSLVLILSAFLLLNIIRIVIFIILVDTGDQYFELVHELTWKVFSTALVVAVWFANVWILKIKAIPAYTDLYVIAQDILGKKGDISHGRHKHN